MENLRKKDLGIKFSTGKHFYCTDYDCNAVIKVSIRLNDECANGHSDFAITADITNWRGEFLMGGCCHDEILKHFPQFKIFVELHLANHLGLPMHAEENGVYWIKQGNEKNVRNHFCFATDGEINDIMKLTHPTALKVYLTEIGYWDRAKAKADKAIALLQDLSGKTWVNPYPDNINRKTYDGSFTSEDIDWINTYGQTNLDTVCARLLVEENDAERVKLIENINKNADAAIRKAELNRKINLIVANITLNDNFIYYEHDNSFNFNWRDYGDKMKSEDVEKVKEKLNAEIKGIKFR